MRWIIRSSLRFRFLVIAAAAALMVIGTTTAARADKPAADSCAAKLNADDFIDNSILSELEKTGFIDQLYEPSAKRQ